MVILDEAPASSSKVLSFHNDSLPSKIEHVKSQLSTGPVVVPPQSEDIVTPNVKQRVVLKAVRPSAKKTQPSASAIRPSSRLEDLPEPLIEMLKNINIHDVIDLPLNREREVLEINPVCPFGQGGLKKMLNDYFVMKKYSRLYLISLLRQRIFHNSNYLFQSIINSKQNSHTSIYLQV